MSENPNEGPGGPQLPEPPEPDKGEQTGYAVYDLTVKRFVGPVSKTAKAAGDAARKVEGHKYETRKV